MALETLEKIREQWQNEIKTHDRRTLRPLFEGFTLAWPVVSMLSPLP